VSPSPRLKKETDLVSETLCFLVFRIRDDGQSPKKKTVILSVVHDGQDTLDSARIPGFDSQQG
jgi:hypothetical protein